MISTTGSRGGKPLVEAGLMLRPRDLRGRLGFYATHTVTAADGTVVRFRLDVGEVRGWIHVEHWPSDAAWAMTTYDIALLAAPQPFGGLKWRFVCPQLGKPCGALHLPTGAGQFASRQAHGLAFLSQRLRAPARAAVRAQRIRIAMGGSADLAAPFPERPKGMWSKSYERRKAVALGFESVEVMLTLACAQLDDFIACSRQHVERGQGFTTLDRVTLI